MMTDRPAPGPDLRVQPTACDEQGGTALVIRSRQPFAETARLKVLIGNRPASSVVLADPGTILCVAPPGREGPADVQILDNEREIARQAAALSFRERAGPNEAGSLPAVTGASGGTMELGKPEDPSRPGSNWWLLHRDLEHSSTVPANGVIPLTNLWARTFSGALIITQPIVGDNTVLAGVWGNGTEAFVALDPGTGDVRWVRTQGQNNSATVNGTPVAAGGRVFFVEVPNPVTTNASPQLVSLQIADGSLAWSATLPEGSQAGLAAAFGFVYVLTRDGTLHAFSAATGAAVWQASLDVGLGQTLSSPAVGFGNVYVGSNEGLRAFDAVSGAPQWAASGSPGNGNASPLVVYDVGVGNPAVVAIGATDDILRAYHVTSGALLWQYDGDLPLWYTTPGTTNGKLYLMQRRTLVELNAVTGAPTTVSPDLGAEVAAAPSIAESHAFAIMRDDRLVSLALGTLTVAAQVTIPSRPAGDFATPSIEAGRLFLTAAQSAPWPAATDTIHAFHKGCLIATAAYGSPLAPQVVYLRTIRDDHLRRWALGRGLLRGLEWRYYKVSPRVAQAMYDHPRFKRAVRWLVVAPFVSLLTVVVRALALIARSLPRF